MYCYALSVKSDAKILWRGAVMKLRKKTISIICALSVAATCLCSACSGDSSAGAAGKETIVLAVSKSYSERLSDLVESFNEQSEKYTVIQSVYDSDDVMHYYFEHGYISPDLIVYDNINSADSYAEQLQPLNRLDAVSSFQVSIVNALKDTDGNLYALPSPGSLYMQCFNKKLFNSINIGESNYPDTIDTYSGKMGVIDIAEKLNEYKTSDTVSYVTEAGEMSMIYTLMEIAVPMFASSTVGVDFLKRYYKNNEETDVKIATSAYSAQWEKILTTYRTLYEKNYYTTDSLNQSDEDAIEKFVSGEAYVCASIPGTSFEDKYKQAKADGTADFTICMYPFVGETENSKWVISKPDFYIGVSRASYNDGTDKYKAIEEFLNYFSSDEVRELTRNGAESLLYTKAAKMYDLSKFSAFAYLDEPIKQNRIYLADTFISVFSSTSDILVDFVEGAATLSETITALDNAVIASAPGNGTIYESECTYDYPEKSDKGITGETAIGDFTADAIAEAAQTDVVILPSSIIRCDIFKGSLDEACLAVVYDNDISLAPVRISGAGIKKILSDMAEDKSFPLIGGFRISGSGENIKLISTGGVVIGDADTVLALLPEEWLGKYTSYLTVGTSGTYLTPFAYIKKYLASHNNTIPAKVKDNRYGGYTIASSASA